MKTKPSLDDLMLFLRVAETGSLSAAAKGAGASVPTLGRHMTRLEAQLGRRLFLRGPAGYALTAEGRELADEALGLRHAAERIDRWQVRDFRAVRVRVTAGFWTSRCLARSIREVWNERAIWVPDFVAENKTVDIARREADIGIRNRRPEQDWLAGRRTRRIDFAEYGVSPEVRGYVTLPAESYLTPSARWVWETHGSEVVMVASDTRLAKELALAGVGRVVLPTFVGAVETGLVRLSEPIAAIGHDEWLVSHHEARHDPPVRAALDAIGDLLALLARRTEGASG